MLTKDKTQLRDRVVHVYDPVIKQNYYYMPGFSMPDCRTVIEATGDVDLPLKEMPGPGSKGHTWSTNGRTGNHCIFIWVRYKYDFATLVHEIVHAAAFALHGRGYEFNTEQEAYSYTSGFLFEEFTKKRGVKNEALTVSHI